MSHHSSRLGAGNIPDPQQLLCVEWGTCFDCQSMCYLPQRELQQYPEYLFWLPCPPITTRPTVPNTRQRASRPPARIVTPKRPGSPLVSTMTSSISRSTVENTRGNGINAWTATRIRGILRHLVASTVMNMIVRLK